MRRTSAIVKKIGCKITRDFAIDQPKSTKSFEEAIQLYLYDFAKPIPKNVDASATQFHAMSQSDRMPEIGLRVDRPSHLNPVDSKFVDLLRHDLGSELLIEGDLTPFGRDETEDLLFLPDLVVRPQHPEQVAQLLKLCNDHRIAVTPRGAGTGLSGGALPVTGGVALDMSRMNRILNIDTDNMQVTVEPGCITEEIQQAVAAHGLYYPPDPSSRGSCSIGGNIAHGAGGPHAVKYGTTRDYVLNLQVALASGELIWTGASVLKYATGYNLTQLMVGSEGTLGVVTQAVLRLIPQPTHTLLMLMPFPSLESACAAVTEIFRLGITPSALEFMERDALELVSAYLKREMHIPDTVQAHLLIELDGSDEAMLQQQAATIFDALQHRTVTEILLAQTASEQQQLWQLRRQVAHAVRAASVYKEEDTVVPRAALPQLINKVKELGRTFGFRSVCYGHAGDGNVHVNVLKGDLNEEQWNGVVQQGIRALFREVSALGGTLSGEHGVGWVQQTYMPELVGETQRQLMRGIKDIFDPRGILNPCKIFSSHAK